MLKKILLFTFCIAISISALAQEVTISGYVSDEESGENLIGADIYVRELPGVGTTTNTYGFYSLTLDTIGTFTLVSSYLGFQDTEKVVKNLKEDKSINFALQSGITIQEVVIKSNSDERRVNSTDMGQVELSTEVIKTLPALMGEVDVLKALQLLPGVISATEGSSGFNVRGGGADQNLILLDEAIVYNASHLLGFFSVFNSDIVKSTKLIKGSIPAEYGGRLSSVIDINSIDGNKKNFQIDGGIGLISSRLTLQGPIVKDKASFVIAGRRTYLLDIAQPFLKGKNFEGTNYYFYDLNAKLNYNVTDKDRLYFSSYFGRDIFKFSSERNGFNFNLPYGNSTASLRWNRIINPKMFMNSTLIFNDYNFEFSGGQEAFAVKTTSGVKDLAFKNRWEYQASQNHKLRWGLDVIHHTLTPSQVEARSEDIEFSNDLKAKNAMSYAIFFSDSWDITSKLRIDYGSRLSAFTQLGPYTSTSGEEYEKNESVITYALPEPRLGMRYLLNKTSSLKAGVSYTVQYLHLVSNSGSTLPVDIWVPSSQRIKPKKGIQYALGYVVNFSDAEYQLTLESYYRDMWGQIDYRDTYVPNITEDIENDFVFGEGTAYGIEVLMEKKKGKLTGWLAYTLSRSERQFPDIEDGRIYPSSFDKTHDLSLVLQYQFAPKWTLSSTFVYGSGKYYTAVEGFYTIESQPVIYYGPRNSSRLEDYHRLDLSLTYDPKNQNKRFNSSWNFSVYNVYNRKNPFFIYSDFETPENGGGFMLNSYKVSIYPIIPSITWNFSWK